MEDTQHCLPTRPHLQQRVAPLQHRVGKHQGPHAALECSPQQRGTAPPNNNTFRTKTRFALFCSARAQRGSERLSRLRTRGALLRCCCNRSPHLPHSFAAKFLDKICGGRGSAMRGGEVHAQGRVPMNFTRREGKMNSTRAWAAHLQVQRRAGHRRCDTAAAVPPQRWLQATAAKT